MGRASSFQAKATGSAKRLVATILDSTSSFWSQLRAKHTSHRAAKKFRAKPSSHQAEPTSSPMAKPRKLLTAISNKALGLRHKKSPEEKYEAEDEGLWQRSILMGEKCEPLDFSGVIYYDHNGKQLDEMPVRSPRVSPLPGYFYESASRREKEF